MTSARDPSLQMPPTRGADDMAGIVILAAPERIFSPFATARHVLDDDVESGRDGPTEAGVANLEERVGELEQQDRSIGKALDSVRSEVVELRADLRTTAAELRGEVAQLRGEMATRRDLADVRREVADLRSDLTRRIDLLEAKVDRHFVWLTGVMVTGFIAMIGAMVGVAFELNSVR
jgi:hypothetical protein